MRALGRFTVMSLLAACGGAPAPPADPPPATPVASAAAASTSDAADAGPASTGSVDAGVVAKIFDRVGELIASRIRAAAGVEYASRQEAQQALDALLAESDWTHYSGMSDILRDLGVKANEVEAFLDQHPDVMKRQASRIAERMREPMHDFEEAIEKKFPKKGK